MTEKIVSRPLFYLVILVCLTFYFYLDIFSGKKSIINLHDSYDQSFMWMSKVFEASRNFEFVLWDFTVHSGTSFVGELQTAPFYLPSLLLAFITENFLTYFHIFIFVHTLLCIFGFFVLLKRYDLFSSVSAISSLLFAFSYGIISRSGGQVNIYASLAWMPIIVLGLDYIFLAKNKKNLIFGVAILSVSTSMSLYAGHTHALVIGVTTGFMLSIARNYITTGNAFELKGECNYIYKTIALLISVILFVIFSLPQLIPTFEYMYLSYKWHSSGVTEFPHTAPIGEITKHPIKFSHLKSLLGGYKTSMYLHVIWITIGLSILINVFWQSNKNSYQTLRFQTVIILINIILILFAFGFIYYYFPILSNVRLPYRWSLGITFCLILLYAISLNSIISALSNNSSAFSKYSNLTNKINSIIIINLKIIVLLISLYSVVLISHNNIERTKRNSYENNVAINAEKTPHFYKLKELMRESNKNGNGLRFYATRHLIPPNIGNKYGFMYSAHGFRSSRTVKYHKFFDFNPLGEKVRSLSIKYWVEKGSNKLLQELDPIFVFDDIRIYELPNVYPILRYSDYNKSHINNDLKKDLKKIHFGTNAVYFNFNQELRGDFIFYSTWYPGFYVKTEHEKVRVTDKDGLMNFVLTHPTNKLTIKYQPNFFSYMAYFYCVLVLSIILYFYIIKSQR